MAHVVQVVVTNPTTLEELEGVCETARAQGMPGQAVVAWNLFGGVTVSARPDQVQRPASPEAPEQVPGQLLLTGEPAVQD